MLSKKVKILGSLIVLAGILLVAGVYLGWPKIARLLAPGKHYVSYFDQSVQGLKAGAEVRYRGVMVGWVTAVKVAPDHKLIAVYMKINLPGDLTANMVAQLMATSVSAPIFIDLQPRDAKAPDKTPELSFTPPYPVIPSQPTDLDKMLSGVNIMVEKISELDTRGVVDQLKSTAAQIEIFFRGKRMEAILTKVEKTLENVMNITSRVDKLLAAGRVEDVLVEAKNTLTTSRGLLDKVHNDLGEINLKETVAKTSSIASEAKAATENARQATETLGALLDRLYDRPPDLLFGQPPRKRWNE